MDLFDEDSTVKILAPKQSGPVQKRNTRPADGCAVWVTVFVFSALSPKSGALYTRPRYSARRDTCEMSGKSAPPPYANTPVVCRWAPATVAKLLFVGSNTKAPPSART